MSIYRSFQKTLGTCVYRECACSWRRKLRDWIRLRRHPSGHYVWSSWLNDMMDDDSEYKFRLIYEADGLLRTPLDGPNG